MDLFQLNKLNKLNVGLMIGLLLLFILLIIFISILCKYFKHGNNKPYLWSYWEDVKGTPDYIPLCKETMLKHCSHSFEIKYLNKKTIKQYIPEENLAKVSHLEIPQRSDYYRIYLLCHFGGVWLDADTIVIKNFINLYNNYINKINDCAFIGCYQCGYHNYNFPNGIIFARKNSPVIKETLELLDQKLNSTASDSSSDSLTYGYFDFGKKVIYQALIKLETNKKSSYPYSKIPLKYVFYKDLFGTYISDDHHLSTNFKIKKNKLTVYPSKASSLPTVYYEKYNDLYLAVLLNNANHRHGRDFVTASREEVLKGRSFISKLFRKSLNIK